MISLCRRTMSVLVLAAICLGIASGCGSGSSSTNGSSATINASAGPAEGEGAVEFRVPGGAKQEVNRIISGSKEASAEELEAASAVLEKSLEARENRDWAVQCETLSKKMEQVVEENGIVIAAHQSCEKNLGAAGAKASSAALANTMEGSIGALRLVGGNQAFAFYHGTDGKNYLIPMELEKGGWRVAALTAQAIPGS
jgi:hypothetical protein